MRAAVHCPPDVLRMVSGTFRSRPDRKRAPPPTASHSPPVPCRRHLDLPAVLLGIFECLCHLVLWVPTSGHPLTLYNGVGKCQQLARSILKRSDTTASRSIGLHPRPVTEGVDRSEGCQVLALREAAHAAGPIRPDPLPPDPLELLVRDQQLAATAADRGHLASRTACASWTWRMPSWEAASARLSGAGGT